MDLFIKYICKDTAQRSHVKDLTLTGRVVIPHHVFVRFTMEGPDIDDPELQGVIPRMIWTVFDGIYSAPEHVEFLVHFISLSIRRSTVSL